ncbi:glutamine-hydrolyzing GMP synthase [Anaerococcus sp. AGMB00486]|uniref:GMP synthase [glutamine-hydrolyzing] n=1 Tax=Anaerococcus faecalis TaxID=2742993 RepID=A0ABX2NAN7_9FIRM|nr:MULTISPECIES: glutamine-hydrolyzing GMP synthase [Anaerococcus]MDY3006938.1 glutamine-hydrolyzing GMP synthase [Anaerococcus porci]NVF11730.1 glutamine-hydrolyzing GMP synthase [Anaerococcus faecalis]
MEKKSEIMVLDFGGQYNQLIVRRVREMGVYASLHDCDVDLKSLNLENLSGIILTGGPQSIHSEESLKLNPEILDLGVPVLGICYGMQALAYHFGGEIKQSEKGEYGKTPLFVDQRSALYKEVPQESIIWMNHRDSVTKLKEGFKKTAWSLNCPIAGFENEEKSIYAVQFHPEVAHSEYGFQILENFVLDICKAEKSWIMKDIAHETIEKIRKEYKGEKMICGLSGGVDSTIAASLVHKAIGDNLQCIFVDHGLLRKDEAKSVMEQYKKIGLNVKMVDASKEFLELLKGVEEPEEKRKIIGNHFIEVFEREAKKFGDAKYLVQGTIYPDVIESGKGKGSVIKSHHNVGGLPEEMLFEGVVEPLRELFKDEVRALGESIGVPEEMVWRQPFPGPGLAIRILGDVTEEKLEIVRETDAILREEVKNAGLDRDIWQYFTVFTPLRTVGVKGDERSYDYVVVVRAVSSKDAMTVEAFDMPYELQQILSNRMINEVRGVGRIVYDITSKPPGTIEWE